MLLKVDYSKAENPNPDCKHKVVELLEQNYDQLTREIEMVIMCSECGENWVKAKNKKRKKQK